MINTSQFGTHSALHDFETALCRCKRITRNLAHRGLPLIVAILGIPAAAQADESSCSLSRAAATWTFTDSGTVIGVGPRVAFGKFTLNASGKLENGVATSSLNGVIADETFYGTYTVNSDCSGVLGSGSGLQFDILVVRDGSSFLIIEKNPPGAPVATTAASEAKRISQTDQ